MKEIASDLFMSELNLLRNRLEAGESLYQCLSSMGTPLEAPQKLKHKFLKIAQLMLEGRTLASSTVKAFLNKLKMKKTYSTCRTKTLSPKFKLLSSLLSLGCLFYVHTGFFLHNLKFQFLFS